MKSLSILQRGSIPYTIILDVVNRRTIDHTFVIPEMQNVQNIVYNNGISIIHYGYFHSTDGNAMCITKLGKRTTTAALPKILESSYLTDIVSRQKKEFMVITKYTSAKKRNVHFCNENIA